jgi:tetratricopeptide (TPR) repeat protein
MITLTMVMNRWPATLHATLATLAPYVCRKVAVVDQQPGWTSLDGEQAAHFDDIKYTQQQTLDQLRNESLRLAREKAAGDWALVIDSDEFIDEQSLLALHAAIAASSDVSAHLLPIHNYVGHGRWTTSYSFRLFHLGQPIEYSYAIHESISPSLVRNGLRWQYLDASIQHLDFVNPVPGKRARYRALLEDAIGRGEDLAFLKSLYAIECFWSGEHDAVLRHLDEAIAIALDRDRNPRFAGRDDFPTALKAYFFLHHRDLRRAESLFERLWDRAEARAAAEGGLGLASIACMQGDHAKALEWIEASLARWESAAAIFSRATVRSELGEPRLALRDIAHGLRLNPLAGDPRILGEPNPEEVFGWQCLLPPSYRGLPTLLQKVTRQDLGAP